MWTGQWSLSFWLLLAVVTTLDCRQAPAEGGPIRLLGARYYQIGFEKGTDIQMNIKTNLTRPFTKIQFKVVRDNGEIVAIGTDRTFKPLENTSLSGRINGFRVGRDLYINILKATVNDAGVYKFNSVASGKNVKDEKFAFEIVLIAEGPAPTVNERGPKPLVKYDMESGPIRFLGARYYRIVFEKGSDIQMNVKTNLTRPFTNIRFQVVRDNDEIVAIGTDRTFKPLENTSLSGRINGFRVGRDLYINILKATVSDAGVYKFQSVASGRNVKDEPFGFQIVLSIRKGTGEESTDDVTTTTVLAVVVCLIVVCLLGLVLMVFYFKRRGPQHQPPINEDANEHSEIVEILPPAHKNNNNNNVEQSSIIEQLQYNIVQHPDPDSQSTIMDIINGTFCEKPQVL